MSEQDIQKKILTTLAEHFNYNLADIVKWLTTPNKDLGNCQPMRLVVTGRSEKVLKDLDWLLKQ